MTDRHSRLTDTHSSNQKKDVQYVALKLREAIQQGEMVPNQRLVEADICEMYDVSRGAVRAALVELTNEGLVERIQNRGAKVRAFTLDQAIEILEVRSAVEGLCARKAAERVTAEDILALQDIGKIMQDAEHAGDRERYSECNKQLHELIIDISGQKTAAEVARRLRSQNVRFQYRLAMHRERPKTSLPEHLEIIEAIASRDPSRAQRAMEVHLASVINATIEINTSGA